MFGLIVLANAVAMGVRTDCQCGSDLLWQVLDNVFLIAFIMEILLRAVISGCRQFGIMLLTDSWVQFDVIVVALKHYRHLGVGGCWQRGSVFIGSLVPLTEACKNGSSATSIPSTGYASGRDPQLFADSILGRPAAGYDDLHSWSAVGDHDTVGCGGNHSNRSIFYLPSHGNVGTCSSFHLRRLGGFGEDFGI